MWENVSFSNNDDSDIFGVGICTGLGPAKITQAYYTLNSATNLRVKK